MNKNILFTPGPTPVPEAVREAGALPIINHRSQDFKNLLQKIRGQLKTLFGTKQEVLTLTSSGTGAMEASLASLLRKSDRVLVVDAGKFGARFASIASAYGLSTDVVKVPWGQAVKVEDLEKRMTDGHNALCIQATETSTGTSHPIAEISKWLQKKFPKVLLIVDGITAVGAEPFPMDELKIDALISGSQKALMMPPGLSFIALSARAEESLKRSDLPKFYFDLSKELKAIQENQTAFTPAISLFVQLEKALSLLEAETWPKVYERHAKLAKASRAALKVLGLSLASENPCMACSAAFFPTGVDGKALLKNIREKYGFTISGGQDAWEGKALRLSHLGYYTPFDLTNALTALGLELKSKTTIEALKSFWETHDGISL